MRISCKPGKASLQLAKAVAVAGTVDVYLLTGGALQKRSMMSWDTLGTVQCWQRVLIEKEEKEEAKLM